MGAERRGDGERTARGRRGARGGEKRGRKEEERKEEERKEEEEGATCNARKPEGPRSRELRKPDNKIQRKVAETPKPFRKQNVLYTYSRCFKIRPSTRLGSALRRTVGRLRLSEPPHMTDLADSSNKNKESYAVFLFEYSKHLFNN